MAKKRGYNVDEIKTEYERSLNQQEQRDANAEEVAREDEPSEINEKRPLIRTLQQKEKNRTSIQIMKTTNAFRCLWTSIHGSASKPSAGKTNQPSTNSSSTTCANGV